jgi:hypothetical protein
MTEPSREIAHLLLKDQIEEFLYRKKQNFWMKDALRNGWSCLLKMCATGSRCAGT